MIFETYKLIEKLEQEIGNGAKVGVSMQMKGKDTINSNIVFNIIWLIGRDSLQFRIIYPIAEFALGRTPEELLLEVIVKKAQNAYHKKLQEMNNAAKT